MSLSPAQVRVIVNTGAFDAALRRMTEAINASAPVVAKFAETLARFQRSEEVAARRHQVRLVTRNKQRRSW